MPKWKIEPVWQDQEVFIIGGAPSLENFNFNLLKGLRTIGCNDAYLHGKEICNIVLFGDYNWYEHHEDRLVNFEGTVFTSLPYFTASPFRCPHWLWWLQRVNSVGLFKDKLGFNYNTGGEAINLALLMGAKTIYLLGFDMHRDKNGRTNYYPNKVDPNQPDNIYDRMLKAMNLLPDILKKKFPGTSVINITDDSSLDAFPKIGVREFWEGRIERCVA